LRPDVEPLGGELRHFRPQISPLGPRREHVRLAPEELVERLVRAPLRVELLEPIDRLTVARIDGVELLVSLDRVLDVRELLLPPPRDCAPQLHLYARLRLELRLPRLHREKVAPALERLVDPDELPHGRQVRRIELHDLRQHRDQRRIALHLIAVDLGDLAKEGEPARHVFLRDLLKLLAE
jgi:hypothetical protein